MERHSEALTVAIDLYLTPSRLRAVQAAALPGRVERVLAIAAGEATVLSEASKEKGRSEEDVKRAAGFFIEHVLFHANADSYRLLGCERSATAADMRRNMGLLMQWIHPDKQAADVRAGLAQRVTNAWETLKSPDRRSQYDLALDAAERLEAGRRRRRGGRAVDRLQHRRPDRSGGFWTSLARVLGFRK